MIRPSRVVIAAAVLSCALVGLAGAAGVVVYDAGLGALPESTGWTYGDFAPGVLAPEVSGGRLRPHATSAIQTRYWARSDVSFVFDATFAMQVTVDVITSDYVPDVGDGTQRSGFYLDLVDSLGRRASLGISGLGATLNTDRVLAPGNGIPITPAGGAHDFQVTGTGDSLVLWIDGIRRGACLLGDSLYSSGSSGAYFGDGSNAAGSELAIALVRYGKVRGTTGVVDPPRADPVCLLLASTARAGGRAIDFALRSPRDGNARVRILDVNGRAIADLGTVHVGAAGARVQWACGGAAPGIYLATATGSAGSARCRVIVLR